jgi:hypothetical protein
MLDVLKSLTIEKFVLWVIAIILAVLWFGPFFGIGDWGGRSGVGCYEEESDLWVCERP